MAEEFEVVELEYSEDDILYHLVDEDDNEVGFVIEEDGAEVECYYEGFDENEYELVSDPNSSLETIEEPSYLQKIAAIAGHEGGKARNAAEEKLDKMRDKAAPHVSKAKATVSEQANKAKAAADDADIHITREGIKDATDNLNEIAKEGAATAKELKEAYDDIMENFGFIVPKNIRRKLP